MTRPKASAAIVIFSGFVLLLVALLIGLVLFGRGSEHEEPSPDDDGGALATGHVHGLGVDPGDGTLYLASHYGVFRVEDGRPQRVADRWQDTMGFAVVGPQHFLASGHPDLREGLPPHLGLIESTDGAQSWEPLSLVGESDLHVIEPTEEGAYALRRHRWRTAGLR